LSSPATEGRKPGSPIRGLGLLLPPPPITSDDDDEEEVLAGLGERGDVAEVEYVDDIKRDSVKLLLLC
jgi:hypothetical protein